MTIGRVEFENGRAVAYDNLGRKRTERPCDSLVGYGPKGFVIRFHGFYHIHAPNGVLVRGNVTERVFLEEQWGWHDDYLQVRR